MITINIGDTITVDGHICRVYKMGDGYALLKEDADGKRVQEKKQA